MRGGEPVSIESGQRRKPRPSIVVTERMKGVGVGIVGPLTIAALPQLTPFAFRAHAMPLVAAALVVAAVLTAAWSRTIALTAAVTVIVINALAFVAQLAIGLSGIVPTDGTLSPAATAWLGVVIALGTSYLVTVLAAAFFGGWALRRTLETR